ncbi:hypothetical protein ACMGDK_11345 [Chryseobacterium sp. DT-3]|uniref:hypothetical protein n=1 Tax=Chryseobacterium sp. DT-3 TaxID=3396164 RepID=UPI003F1CBD92
MQNPLQIKELGNWIWGMIQKVFVFFFKPLGGIMMVLVTVIAGAIYGDIKSQSGYNQGMKNQRIADSIYIYQLDKSNKDLINEKIKLEAKIDTMKNVNCAEENRKALAYVEGLNKELEKYNQSQFQRLKSINNENKAVKNDIKNLEKWIPKTQKQ